MSDKLTDLIQSLIKFQSIVKPIPRSEEAYKYNYAPLEKIWEAIKSPLADQSLAISQVMEDIEGKPFLTTLLLHSSGQYISSNTPIICSKPNDPQSMGSAITYARRYGLSAILNLVTEEDDDGAAAKPNNHDTIKTNQDNIVKAFETAAFNDEDFPPPPDLFEAEPNKGTPSNASLIRNSDVVGDVIVTIGSHKGKTLNEIWNSEKDRGWLTWAKQNVSSQFLKNAIVKFLDKKGVK